MTATELVHLGHACVVVDTGTSRILLDPGAFSDGWQTLEGLDAILVTHQRPPDPVLAVLDRHGDLVERHQRAVMGGLVPLHPPRGERQRQRGEQEVPHLDARTVETTQYRVGGHRVRDDVGEPQ